MSAKTQVRWYFCRAVSYLPNTYTTDDFIAKGDASVKDFLQLLNDSSEEYI